MKSKINSVLEKALEQVKPSEFELKGIESSLKELKEKIISSAKALKIDVEFFVGGSYAKSTLVRKDKYDIDIFMRFDNKHKEISKLTENILKKARFKFEKIHGSRDYFRVKVSNNLFFEIIPVLKIKTPGKAENITDLSYSHVRYINKKVKSQKVKDDIRLAKAFCYANNCYGAESYINGFSGYSLELLVYNYKSFVMFLNQISKVNDKKIIDIENHHKNKKTILLDLNESKLYGPIILIDPTYKYRNVLAALNYKTFEVFKKAAKDFLKKPSINSFEKKKIDFDNLKKEKALIIELKTGKQAGDIAGSKLLKFYNHLSKEISKYFTIKATGFEYNQKQSAKCFFKVKKKHEVLISGPKTSNEKHAKRFKKAHKKAYVKKGRLYAKKQIPKSLKNFLTSWKRKNSKIMKEMSVDGIKVD